MLELKVIAEPNSQNIYIDTLFDAPLATLFRYFVEKELIQQWWGINPTVRVEEFDAKAGGKWRIVEVGEDGQEYGFHGVFHEVIPYERVIQTFEYEGLPETGHVTLERDDFEDAGYGMTRLRTITTFQSVEDRDGMLQSGMEAGMRHTYEKLQMLVNMKEKVACP